MEQQECKDDSEEQENVDKPVEEEMCESGQSLQEETSPHTDEDDDGDDADDAECSTETSRLFAPSSEILHDTYKSEDQTDEATSLEATSSQAMTFEATQSEATASEVTFLETTSLEDMSLGTMSFETMSFETMSSYMSQLTGRKRGKNIQGTDECQPPKFSKLKFHTDDFNCKVGIKNRMYGLQQQLTEVLNENQMLNKLQHHHTVALQHFEEMESRISETLARHARHIKVLQIMLRETRTCRDHLAKQLVNSEYRLLKMRDTLQNLQKFSQDHSLLEREDLTHMLAQATAELEEKDKRIQVLEKNLYLCQAYFNHQLVREQRKLDEERKFSCYLQEQFNQLTKETKDRTRKLEESNAYLKFLLKESKRDRQNKMVQTERLALLPAEAVRLLEFHLTGNEEKLKDSANLKCIYREQKRQENTVNVSQDYSDAKAEKRPDEATKEEEATETSNVSVMSQQTEEHKEKAKYLKTAKFNREKIKKINNYYPFNQTIINLCHGRPAYSAADISPCEDTEIGNHVYVVRLPAVPGWDSEDTSRGKNKTV